ncbi:MAG: hypothetical protein V4692_09995, partial [Bdellovibrionota bacterium]
MRSRFALIFSLVLLVGCSTFRKNAKQFIDTFEPVEHILPEPPPPEVSQHYLEGYSLLLEEKYPEAYEKFQKLLQDEPVTPWTQAANLNAARALEGMERWDEAATRYRGIITTTDDSPKLRAMALYRLSFCHEALGDEQQVVAVLNDLLTRKKYLPSEVAAAELPARLGSAYARVGNFDRAVELYRSAESGIARLRRSEKGDVPSWLPRTLFFMGEMSHRKVTWEQFGTALRPLTRAQVYLLQTAELAKEPWADRSANEISAVYRDLMTVVEMAPAEASGDPVYVERERQKRQWDRAVLLLDTIAELRARAVPGSEKIPAVAEIFAALDAVEKRIQNLLLERPAGEGLTREALARKSGTPIEVIAPDKAQDGKLEE